MQINFENLTIGVFAKAAGVNVDHPVLPAQGPAAGARQALWQHSPLWRGGCNTSAVREIGPAAGL